MPSFRDPLGLRSSRMNVLDILNLRKKKARPQNTNNNEEDLPGKEIQKDQNQGTSGPPEVLRDKNGNLSGINFNGRTFLGLNPDDVNKIADAQRRKTQLPAGTVETGDARQAERDASLLERNQILQEDISGVSQPPELGTRGTAQGPDLADTISQAALKGGVSAGAAAGSAALASVVGAPLSAPIAGTAAAAGAAAGVGAAYLSLRQQYQDIIDVQTGTLQDNKRNLKTIIASTTPENADENVDMFIWQLNQIDTAHGNLYLSTRNDAAKFLAKDGKTELAKFARFNDKGGQRDLLIRAMQIKVAGGDASALLAQADALEIQG